MLKEAILEENTLQKTCTNKRRDAHEALTCNNNGLMKAWTKTPKTFKIDDDTGRPISAQHMTTRK